MTGALDFLADNILFTLVLILAVGLVLGKIRIFGISLGAAAVLFVALGLTTVRLCYESRFSQYRIIAN